MARSWDAIENPLVAMLLLHTGWNHWKGGHHDSAAQGDRGCRRGLEQYRGRGLAIEEHGRSDGPAASIRSTDGRVLGAASTRGSVSVAAQTNGRCERDSPKTGGPVGRDRDVEVEGSAR